MANGGRLKLRARDSEDFAVISAVLQDALVPVRDMTQLTREKRFVFVANRFRWEARIPLDDLPDRPRDELREREGDARFEDAPLYERVHCGATFDRVRQVFFRGFDRRDSDQVLDLLAVVPDREGVTITFAGDAAVRLSGRRIVCHLEDLGDPWPTLWRPSHGDAESLGEADSSDEEERSS